MNLAHALQSRLLANLSTPVVFPMTLTGTQTGYIVRGCRGAHNVSMCATIITTNEIGLLYRRVCGPTVRIALPFVLR